MTAPGQSLSRWSTPRTSALVADKHLLTPTLHPWVCWSPRWQWHFITRGIANVTPTRYFDTSRTKELRFKTIVLVRWRGVQLELAPRPGLEPGTYGLTDDRSVYPQTGMKCCAFKVLESNISCLLRPSRARGRHPSNTGYWKPRVAHCTLVKGLTMPS